MQKMINFPLRVPPALDKAIRTLAHEQGRSYNSQVIIMLRQQVPAELLAGDEVPKND